MALKAKWRRVEASFRFRLLLSMIFSDLASPAEAPTGTTSGTRGFAQAGNRYPPRIESGASFFGIML
jgi:hypothetical protein